MHLSFRISPAAVWPNNNQCHNNTSSNRDMMGLATRLTLYSSGNLNKSCQLGCRCPIFRKIQQKIPIECSRCNQLGKNLQHLQLNTDNIIQTTSRRTKGAACLFYPALKSLGETECLQFCIPLISVLHQYTRVAMLHSVDFFHNLCICFETSSVHFMSCETDISHGPLDDLASKQIHFYVFQAAPKRKFDILQVKMGL